MDFDEKLIEEVCYRPILYDLGQPQYRNVKMKELAWREIATNLGLNELDCKKRWKILRDSYKRSKRMQQLCSGSGADVIKRKWRYFDSLSFLDGVASTRQSIGNICCAEELVEEISIEEADELLSPAPANLKQSRKKNKDDSSKFQDFLDVAAASIAEISSKVGEQRELDSTSIVFNGLAKKIKESGMPPSFVNAIEAKVTTLVYQEIQKFYESNQ